MTFGALLTIAVGVVVERSKAASPWLDFVWRPAAVLPDTDQGAGSGAGYACSSDPARGRRWSSGCIAPTPGGERRVASPI